MKQIFSVALLVLTVICLPATADTKKVAAQKNAQIGQEIQKMEAENNDIWSKLDATRLENLLTDEFLFSDLDGKVYDKAGLINFLKTSSYRLESAINSDFKVRVYGEVVVATFLTTGSGVMNGQRFKGQARYTDVWVKRKGQWKLAGGHASLVEGSLVLTKP